MEYAPVWWPRPPRQAKLHGWNKRAKRLIFRANLYKENSPCYRATEPGHRVKWTLIHGEYTPLRPGEIRPFWTPQWTGWSHRSIKNVQDGFFRIYHCNLLSGLFHIFLPCILQFIVTRHGRRIVSASSVRLAWIRRIYGNFSAVCGRLFSQALI